MCRYVHHRHGNFIESLISKGKEFPLPSRLLFINVNFLTANYIQPLGTMHRIISFLKTFSFSQRKWKSFSIAKTSIRTRKMRTRARMMWQQNLKDLEVSRK